jgi:phosphoribosyl-AMP cyclohydrolase
MSGRGDFPTRGSREEVEEGGTFAPKFDRDGLIACVTTDARTGDVLMLAHMDATALHRTIATGEAWYFSRSRGKLWRKGETSGHVQRVVEMRTDCDQDAIWMRVSQEGLGACHTGRYSCFYRAVRLDGSGTLELRDSAKVFDPQSIYGQEKL